LREGVGPAAAEFGYTLKYDLSLPTEHFYKIVEETRVILKNSDLPQSVKDSIISMGYGHIGDGNLHLNICLPGYDDRENIARLEAIVEPFVMGYVKQAGGSVSAEHGIGRQKTSFLSYSKSAPMIEYMRRIKGAFDPNGILNPYKVLPTE
jgi:FAD/FMN-containing dehydrogenase